MSKIEWTQKTWNPLISGCSMISDGCTNCYAMKMAYRLEAIGQEKYKGLTHKTEKGNIVWNGKINIDFDDKALYEPIHQKKPTTYFVNSMTDIFHEKVPFEAINKIMAVIAICPQHTFQVLTKRPERMKEYFGDSLFDFNISQEIAVLCHKNLVKNSELQRPNLPLKNLWLGVFSRKSKAS